MSRAQAIVYLIAPPGHYVAFAIVAVAASSAGPLATAVQATGPLVLVLCCSAIFAIAVRRVQRGDVAADDEGTVLPIAGEFVTMSPGARVPSAWRVLRDRSVA